jgi:ABC-type phosphate transport system permease subunit
MRAAAVHGLTRPLATRLLMLPMVLLCLQQQVRSSRQSHRAAAAAVV